MQDFEMYRKLFLLIFEIDIHVALSFFSVRHDYNFFMYS